MPQRVSLQSRGRYLLAEHEERASRGEFKKRQARRPGYHYHAHRHNYFYFSLNYAMSRHFAAQHSAAYSSGERLHRLSRFKYILDSRYCRFIVPPSWREILRCQMSLGFKYFLALCWQIMERAIQLNFKMLRRP